jgi:hypothetical protein
MYNTLAYTDTDEDVEIYMTRWVKEAGGKISLTELERRFSQQFKFKPEFLIGDEEMSVLPNHGKVFKLEDNMVSEM